eukprot:39773-Rhodomonas_salina.1
MSPFAHAPHRSPQDRHKLAHLPGTTAPSAPTMSDCCENQRAAAFTSWLAANHCGQDCVRVENMGPGKGWGGISTRACR